MPDNSQGFAALEAMIERVRSLPDMAREAAPMVALELKREIATAISEERTPEGVPWVLTQDGHQPLKNAMSAIDVVAVNTDVIATLSGFHIFHQRGSQSRHARAAERAAGTARAKAKKAIRENQKMQKKASLQSGRVESRAVRLTKKGNKTKGQEKAEAKALAYQAEAKETATIAHGAGEKATAATAKHAEVKSHGGLPARPMIPESMPGEFSRAIRAIYKQRFDEKMAVAS
jgi:hypothetical protein